MPVLRSFQSPYFLWQGVMSRQYPVALFFHRLGKSGGGAQRMICQLANALVERNFTTHVVSWDDPEAQSHYPLDARVIWNRMGFRPGMRDKVRRTAQLARLFRHHGIRALVGFVMPPQKSVLAAAKIARVRLIAAERNAPAMYRMTGTFPRRWLDFGLLHLADRIAVQFPQFVDGYPASLRSRIEVIPNPVRPAARRASPGKPNADERFTLLAVGRLDRVQKRHDALVRGFARLAGNFPAWDLRIFGDGVAREELLRLADDLGVRHRVYLEKWTSDIFTVYANSHLFAMPSRWEGFPNALTEAMSHGLPAVGFRDAPGVAQLIADGETGWLADDSRDETALAQVLAKAMSAPAERVRRGSLAADSMANYPPEVQFDRWATLLDSIVGTHQRLAG